ncbi:hypothetical protein D7004_15695 [Pedobacter jejuensis]|uniref:Uncharacterized protein n=1 Tax=Pedobacter jejuensis TaxID=1268550 RepID=A0A3N0BQ95_9SPHI|nr:hypothetical protein D7004_15695 [Pedobacter jejuensis]
MKNWGFPFQSRLFNKGKLLFGHLPSATLKHSGTTIFNTAKYKDFSTTLEMTPYIPVISIGAQWNREIFDQ